MEAIERNFELTEKLTSFNLLLSIQEDRLTSFAEKLAKFELLVSSREQKILTK